MRRPVHIGPARTRVIRPDAISALLVTNISGGVVCNALGVTFNGIATLSAKKSTGISAYLSSFKVAFPVVVTRILSRAIARSTEWGSGTMGKTVLLAAKGDFASARRWRAENAHFR